MKYPRLALYIALILLNAGCGRFKLAMVNAPVSFAELKIIRDIAYGPDAGQKLDIYTPLEASQKKLPVVVFLYGGRWTEGAKADYGFVADTLVRRGYIVVIPDYAKYPKVKFPVFVEDAAKALAWVHNNIGAYNGNTEQVYLMGHSAGAHIGALLISDTHYLKVEGQSPKIVRAFVGLSGPYDFTPDEPDLVDMFGPAENFPKMQVAHFITGHEPPMLLVRGDRDTLVKGFNIDRVAARVHEKHGHVETISYRGMDHVWAIGAFSWAGRGKYTIVDDVIHFFAKHP